MGSSVTFANGVWPRGFLVLWVSVFTAGRGLEQPRVSFSVSFAFLLIFLQVLEEDRDLERPTLSFSCFSVFSLVFLRVLTEDRGLEQARVSSSVSSVFLLVFLWVLTEDRDLEQPGVSCLVSFVFSLVFLRILTKDRHLEPPRVSCSVSSFFKCSLLETVQQKWHGISSCSILKKWSHLENTYLSPLCCLHLFFSLFPPSPSQHQCLCFFVIFPQSEEKSEERSNKVSFLHGSSCCKWYLWTLTMMSLWFRSCTFSMRKEISSPASSNFFFSASSSFRCKLLASSAFRSTFYNKQIQTFF